MDLLFFSCIAVDEGDLKNQVDFCLNQLSSFLSEKGLQKKHIVTQNIFLNASNNREYLVKKEEVKSILKADYSDIPSNYLAQLPANGADVAFEYHIWGHDLSDIIIENRKYRNIPYKVVTETNKNCKYLFTAGIANEDVTADMLKCTEDAFFISRKILEENRMSFGNVFRQWNYVENILKTSTNSAKTRQNYQILNDIRTYYYNKDQFNNGYPAATGIGMHAGGVILSFYAVSCENNVEIKSIENPLQVPAFNYSENVLIGDSTYQECTKTSPKFARAKFVGLEDMGYVWVSGTASIRGEQTIGLNDVVEQTKVTLENIQNIISDIGNVDLVCLRGYIKKIEFHESVFEVCKKLYPDTQILLVVADVCRNDLFVEIEAVASSRR